MRPTLTLKRLRLAALALVCAALALAAASVTAGSPAQIVVQGEELAAPATGTKTVADATARDGRALALRAQRTATAVVSGTIGRIDVRVRGTRCEGAARFSVLLNGEPVGVAEAPSSGWRTLQFPLRAVSKGRRQVISVGFRNDRDTARCDRNLFIDEVVAVKAFEPVATRQVTAAGVAIQGETLIRVPAEAGGPYTDAAAEGGKAMVLARSGYVGQTTSAALTTISMRLKADLCGGPPRAVLVVDGLAVSSFDVPWTSWYTHTVTLAKPLPALTKGTHSIWLMFVNDYNTQTCDRNVRIDWFGWNMPSKPATSAPVDTRPKLRWAPPALTTPTTVTADTNNQMLQLDTTKDYIVKLPATVKNGLWIKGGRNVVVIGGQLRITKGTALYITDSTGIVHVEGVFIDNTGAPAGDAISIKAPKAIVQLQNIRIIGVTGTQEGEHGDILQPFGGVDRLRVDRLTGYTGYQGLFLRPTDGPIGWMTLRNIDLNYVNSAKSFEGGDLLWFTTDCVTAPTELTEVYVGTPLIGLTSATSVWPKPWDKTCPAQTVGSQVSWPTLPIVGVAKLGQPAAGNFVKAGSVGLGYTTPGYL